MLIWNTHLMQKMDLTNKKGTCCTKAADIPSEAFPELHENPFPASFPLWCTHSFTHSFLALYQFRVWLQTCTLFRSAAISSRADLLLEEAHGLPRLPEATTEHKWLRIPEYPEPFQTHKNSALKKAFITSIMHAHERQGKEKKDKQHQSLGNPTFPRNVCDWGFFFFYNCVLLQEKPSVSMKCSLNGRS